MIQKCELFLEKLSELRRQVNISKFVYRKYKQQGDDYRWHSICATMDRLDDTAKYLNSIKIDWDKEFAVFKFYELLNYTCQIRDMVYDLAEIFSTPLFNIKESKVIFGNIGNEKASDDKYIDYLRSLCAIHSTKTDHYIKAGYQETKEYCPYLGEGGRFNSILKHDKKEIRIRVYQNDAKKHDKFIFIKMEDILKYLYMRYENIDHISKQIHKLRNKKL